MEALALGRPVNDQGDCILLKSALIAATGAVVLSTPAAHPHIPARQCGEAASFRQFSSKVWAPSHWRRGSPSTKALSAKRARLNRARGCGYRGKLRATWRKDKRRFYKHRAAMLFRERVTPFFGCIGEHCWWAIPAYVVECESGGRYNDPSAPNGAYSLLTGPIQGVPTWESWRPGWADGYAAPYQAPPKAQDIAAHRLWATYGSEPWECA